MNWLNSNAFTVYGQSVIWSDLLGNLLGLAALPLGWRRSMATWPVQLIASVILVVAYSSAHLTGGVGKQAIVVVVSVWGWWQWRHGRTDTTGKIRIRFATWPERAALVAGTAAGTALLAWLFTAYPSLSWNPWPDAYIFVGTLAAMIAQSRGWVEFWIAWLAVDLVGVPLAFNSGLKFSALVYIVYFVMVILGLRSWWMSGRTAPAADGSPRKQGALA